VINMQFMAAMVPALPGPGDRNPSPEFAGACAHFVQFCRNGDRRPRRIRPRSRENRARRSFRNVYCRWRAMHTLQRDSARWTGMRTPTSQADR
jgi:hypothetical protein